MLGHRSYLNQAGSTLVESLVAFVIMAGTAAAVYPVFTQTKEQSKQGDVRQFCENIVRSKLDEYRLGKPVMVADAALPNAGTVYSGMTAMPSLNNLSFSVLSTSVVGGVGGNAATTQSSQVGGFFYAKLRYNRYYPYSCNGLSQAQIFAANAADLAPMGINVSAGGQPLLGMRECIGNNKVLDSAAGLDPTAVTGCDTPIDVGAQQEMPGFKLYVRLELATSWPIPTGPAGIVTTGSVAKDKQFGAPGVAAVPAYPSCPDFFPYSPTPPVPLADLYDFDGAGDAIRVTVTGVVDIASMNLTHLGGLKLDQAGTGKGDWKRLLCSASAIVAPDPPAVRYYLKADGKIYNFHGFALNGSNAVGGGWALQTLYTQAGSAASGISSLAVHPRSLSVYVLRPGSILRYSNCGGVPLDCSAVIDNNGISDSGKTPWPSVQEWSIMSSVRYLGVDFRSGAVYGMSGDRTAIYSVVDSSGNPLASCSNGCQAGLGASVKLGQIAPFTVNALGNTSSFFMSPEGDEFYVTDQLSRSGMGATTYNTTVYRATDTNHNYPIVTFPVAAVSFSK